MWDATVALFGFLADFATFLGIPIAIAVYYREKRREQRDREYGTYHALDEKYIDFLRLCLERPELKLYPKPDAIVDEALKGQQLALFEILVALLERAYLMYFDQSDAVKTAQWRGWKAYIDELIRAPQFWSLWKNVGAEQFDRGFAEHMIRLRPASV